MSHTRHFVLQGKLFREVFGPTIRIPEYYSGCKKTRIPNTEYYLVLRKSEYQIQILLFGPTIRIVFEYRIICHTLWHVTHDNFFLFVNFFVCFYLFLFVSVHLEIFCISTTIRTCWKNQIFPFRGFFLLQLPNWMNVMWSISCIIQ